MSDPSHHACIEAGGTKFMLGIVDEERRIVERLRVPTTTPDETIAAALAFFTGGAERYGGYRAIGIASFGPAVLDRASPRWGHIGATPKAHWSGTDLAGPFAAAFGVPVGFDTDVNAAALAESLWGAAGGVAVASYITIGTGIGGGAVIGGRTLHGAMHPEMGHCRPARHPADAHFPGICPFHGACFEGLASGPAIIARWGASLSNLPPDHEGHAIIAHYVAQLVIALQALLSAGRVVLGGGVMATPGLIARVRLEAARLGGGYFGETDYAALVVPPGLGTDSGLLGAAALAMGAARP